MQTTQILDRESRRSLAELLRHLVAGLITNDEFENQRPRGSHDLAVRQVFEEGAWFLYDDTCEHRLIGRRRLATRDRQNVARWILFLETDLTYEWPVVPFGLRLALIPLNLLTLGLLGRVVQRFASSGGPTDLWPFRRHSDYQAALQEPPYLKSAV
jgi:hypothetical protein